MLAHGQMGGGGGRLAGDSWTGGGLGERAWVVAHGQVCVWGGGAAGGGGGAHGSGGEWGGGGGGWVLAHG